MKQAWEEMGYEVELVPAESATRYEAVRVGELHVAHETWQSTMAKPMYEAMDKGGLIDAGLTLLLHLKIWVFLNGLLMKIYVQVFQVGKL